MSSTNKILQRNNVNYKNNNNTGEIPKACPPPS